MLLKIIQFYHRSTMILSITHEWLFKKLISVRSATNFRQRPHRTHYTVHCEKLIFLTGKIFFCVKIYRTVYCNDRCCKKLASILYSDGLFSDPFQNRTRSATPPKTYGSWYSAHLDKCRAACFPWQSFELSDAWWRWWDNSCRPKGVQAHLVDSLIKEKN